MAREVKQVTFTKAAIPMLTRVAAYARVSSAKNAMHHSLSAQVSYYSGLIQNHPGWQYIAKNLVAAGLADKCQLELAYAIGVAQPVSVLVDSYGTGKVSDERLGEIVRACFDLRPAAIIKALDLRRPIYQQVAAYGHFGRPELDLPWEKTDRVQELLAKA